MKVVHVNKLPNGGAALCAMRISEALQKKGVESQLLLMQGNANKNTIIPQKDFLYRTQSNVVMRLLMKIVKVIVRPRFEYYKYKRHCAERKGGAFFTSLLTEYRSLAHHPLIETADVVHLHWIADFVDFPSFFKEVKKPIVWTIHDENPGLGGFHYVTAMESANARYIELDRQFAEIKKKAVNGKNKPCLVAVSTKMKKFFESNEILKECPVRIIYNGVDADSYRMMDRNDCRKAFNIPADRKVFLFSSFAIEDKRKGLLLLIEALESLHDDNIVLICLGGYKKVPKTGIEIRCVGLVGDKELLSRYYSAADYFVLSSFQEAFAQTPLESMSCGTPVVAFPCSGVPDLLNEKNGVICDDFTVEALAKGIKEAMDKEFDRESIRKDVLSRFSYDKIASQYMELYQELLKP